MVGRVLHSREFLLDLRAVLTREAPALLEQPIAQNLNTAWDLCAEPEANDYDPRLRNALGTVAHILEVDVGSLRAVSEIPLPLADVLKALYDAGNRHSLAQYMLKAVSFLLTNKNVESVDIGPAGEDAAMNAHIPSGKTLWLNFSPDYRFEGNWQEAELTHLEQMYYACFPKEFLRDRGLEFFTDFAGNSTDRSWIAFINYRLALGRKELVSPWVPLPHWQPSA